MMGELWHRWRVWRGIGVAILFSGLLSAGAGATLFVWYLSGTSVSESSARQLREKIQNLDERERRLGAEAVSSVPVDRQYERQQIAAARTALWQEWDDYLTQSRLLRRWLMVAGLLAFLFGVVLPLYIFRRLYGRLMEAQKRVATEIAVLLHEWLAAKESAGAEALSNWRFWSDVGLILVSRLGLYSRHPFLQVAGDLAQRIREEVRDHSEVRPRKRKKSRKVKPQSQTAP